MKKKTHCYRLNCVSPQNHKLKPQPQCDCIWRLSLQGGN